MKLSDPPCLQNTSANIPPYLQKSAKYLSRNPPQTTNTDSVSPLAAGCETFTLSSSMTLFVCIYWGSQHHPNRFHTYDYSHSFRSTVWEVGSEVWVGGDGLCLARVTNAENGSLFRNESHQRWTCKPCCWSVLLLHCSALQTGSYLEETRRGNGGRSGRFVCSSAIKYWISQSTDLLRFYRFPRNQTCKTSKSPRNDIPVLVIWNSKYSINIIKKLINICQIKIIHFVKLICSDIQNKRSCRRLETFLSFWTGWWLVSFLPFALGD